ncbi:hypothetical protein V8C44DRAFT_321514 [Trichoderma aethiopicum]
MIPGELGFKSSIHCCLLTLVGASLCKPSVLLLLLHTSDRDARVGKDYLGSTAYRPRFRLLCCGVVTVSQPDPTYLLYGISKRLGQQCNSVLQDISSGIAWRRLALFRQAGQSSAAASVVSSSPRLCPQQRAQAALSQIAKETRHGKPLVAAHPAHQALPSPKALHTSTSVSYTTAATGASFADQGDVGLRPRLVFAQAESKGTIRWSK